MLELAVERGSNAFEAEKSEENSYIWETIRAELFQIYGEANFKSFLSKIRFVSSGEGRVVLAAPTSFIRDWVYANFGSRIKQLWQKYVENVYSLDIIVGGGLENLGTMDSLISEVKNIETNAKEEKIGENLLHILEPRYTFNNFIVGKPNEFAYAAARSVADSGKVQAESNPLFLYGGVGLGKTHLMHAIAWHILETNPNRKVIYISAEKFMNRFIQALKDKDIMSFKELFRNVDVLMIDDVQFICGKDSTQEEFFHTFNALFDKNRQVVISADRSPSDLEGMEDRLKSRLGWGLVADVHSTNYELRLGILESKIEQLEIDVPHNVLEFLASKITSNVRELEGALNKITSNARMLGREITLEGTQDLLRDLLRSNEKLVTIDDIQKKVADHFNIKISDMSSTRKMRNLARPRQVAMYFAKVLTSKSLMEIGKKFGGKDHTTVIHANKTVLKLIEEDQEFREDVNLIRRILTN